MIPTRRRRAAIALCASSLLLAVPETAAAEIYTVAQRPLEVETPSAYCRLDRDRTAEDALFRVIEEVNAGLNRVLSVFVDCDELAQWRQGVMVTIERYGQVLTPAEEIAYAGLPRRIFLDELQKVMGSAFATGLEQGRDRMAAVLPKLKLGEVRSLGLLATDELALYAGMAELMAGNEGARVIAGIVAMTLINEVPVSVNLYRTYEGPESIDALLVEQQKFLRELMAGNETLESRQKPTGRAQALNGG